MAAQNEINAFRVRARRKSPRCLPYVAGIGNACLARKALCRPQPLARRCASVACTARPKRRAARPPPARPGQRPPPPPPPPTRPPASEGSAEREGGQAPRRQEPPVLDRLVSNDYPRSKPLAVILIAVLLGLALAPFLLPGVKALSVAAKVLVFVVLVASFDLLLGYTGIVSFAHTMFFGIGAYGIAVASTRLGPTWPALALGLGGALLLSLLLSLAMGLFSLRVRAIFFAMITLAVASAFQTLASQLPDITAGEDRLTFSLPALLSTEFEVFGQP